MTCPCCDGFVAMSTGSGFGKNLSGWSMKEVAYVSCSTGRADNS